MSLNEEKTEEPFIEVRDYRPADFPSLCELDRICFSEAIAYSPEEIALGLVQPGAFALVVEVRNELQNEVVAFVLAYQNKKQLGHIVTIDVLPEYRWKGLGKKLMGMAEERLRKKGAVRVILEVSVQNEPAIRFYQSLGYARKRLLTRYYPDGSDAYLMEKIFN